MLSGFASISRLRATKTTWPPQPEHCVGLPGVEVPAGVGQQGGTCRRSWGRGSGCSAFPAIGYLPPAAVAVGAAFQPHHLSLGQRPLEAEHLRRVLFPGAGWTQKAVSNSARLATVMRLTSTESPSGRACPVFDTGSWRYSFSNGVAALGFRGRPVVMWGCPDACQVVGGGVRAEPAGLAIRGEKLPGLPVAGAAALVAPLHRVQRPIHDCRPWRCLPPQLAVVRVPGSGSPLKLPPTGRP